MALTCYMLADLVRCRSRNGYDFSCSQKVRFQIPTELEEARFFRVESLHSITNYTDFPEPFFVDSNFCTVVTPNKTTQKFSEKIQMRQDFLIRYAENDLIWTNRRIFPRQVRQEVPLCRVALFGVTTVSE